MKFSAILLIIILISFASCREINKPPVSNTDSTAVDGHPAWIMQGNIYEVNVRQYTPEGTFNAFSAHLDRLQKMGVQTLWFMPVHPISKVDRKGVMGSYYAIADYRGINPEFGTMQDWKTLVDKAHGMGMKVIIDWVPNHTGADHPWLSNHPDFFVRDSISGKPVSPFDWSDVRKLDYNNRILRDSMINTMKFWVTETGIDGFRCDVAGEVPDDFWKTCLEELKKTKNDIFLLAEGEKPSLHESGFDASYGWRLFHIMKQIASGERKASAIDSAVTELDSTYPRNALKLLFTSNHDENSWNKADYGTMPGAKHAPFAVLTQTFYKSIPLIYSGQEEPVMDSISFFYKDTIMFNRYARSTFYKTLLELRKNNAALSSNASFRKVNIGDENALYAFVRESGNNKVLVILNLSSSNQRITVEDASLHGNPYNVFMGVKEPLNNETWEMQPWGYAIYVY